METWVKICGITRPGDARAAFDAGADAIGINFSSGSRRFCRPEAAREILTALRHGELAFGVFVGATRDEIRRTIDEIGIGGVQLHGNEPDELASGWDVPVLRAVAAGDRDTVRVAIDACDRVRSGRTAGYRLLIDHASGGGSGMPVDETLLDGLELGDAILAGGLTPANVAARVARFRPYGVDTAGGVERAAGIKDHEAVRAFVRSAKGRPE